MKFLRWKQKRPVHYFPVLTREKKIPTTSGTCNFLTRRNYLSISSQNEIKICKTYWFELQKISFRIVRATHQYFSIFFFSLDKTEKKKK
jgi:hypothetical protein